MLENDPSFQYVDVGQARIYRVKESPDHEVTVIGSDGNFMKLEGLH